MIELASLLIVICLTPIASAIIIVHLYLLTGWPDLPAWFRWFREERWRDS